MAVSTAYTPLEYAGNGATTAFAVSWPFFASSDLLVYVVSSGGTATLKTITTHYTVTGGTDANGLPATGTVTMLTAPAVGETLRIKRATSKVQAATWTESDGFPQKTVEAAFDRAMLIGQEAVYTAENPDSVNVTAAIGTVTTGAAGSSASATVTESPSNTFTFDFTIPRGATGASGAGTGDVVGPASATDGGIVLFDGTTGKLVKDPTYTITAAGAAILDDANAAAQRTTLGVGAVGTQGDGGKGDITVSATGATWTINNDAVTYAKIQNTSIESVLIGRGQGGGAGDVQEISLGSGLSMSGSTITSSAAISAATQAEQESAASTTVYTSPGRQHYHPGMAKAWVNFGVTGSVNASYNINSITDNGVGDWTVNIETDFSSANYAGVISGGRSGSNVQVYSQEAIAAGTYRIRGYGLSDTGCGGSGAVTDPTTPAQIHAVFYGDHA